MLGAVLGDIAGSRFEWNNIKTKEFELFTNRCHITDDSVMTFAIAKAILDCEDDYSDLGSKAVEWMQFYGRAFPNAGYGGSFANWLFEENPLPYNSWGNGAAMRVSPCGFAAKSLEEAIMLSKKVTEVTHNHPEGIKGAEATAVAIYLAKKGSSKEEIKSYINEHYYKIDFTLDEIRADYSFDVSCQGSVPQALEAFFEAKDYEDTIRNAISIGGDSDTLAAIAGGIAEAHFGIPDSIKIKGDKYVPDILLDILVEFRKTFMA